MQGLVPPCIPVCILKTPSPMGSKFNFNFYREGSRMTCHDRLFAVGLDLVMCEILLSQIPPVNWGGGPGQVSFCLPSLSIQYNIADI